MFQQTQGTKRRCHYAFNVDRLEMILNSTNRFNSFFRLAKGVAHHHGHDDHHNDKKNEPSYGHLVQLVTAKHDTVLLT